MLPADGVSEGSLLGASQSVRVKQQAALIDPLEEIQEGAWQLAGVTEAGWLPD